MNKTVGARKFDLKWFGTLTPMQLFGLFSAFFLALVLTLYGFGTSCYCFGMLIIAVILYMLPKMLGVENIKLMTLLGVLFAVSAILIGGLVMAPGFVASNDGNPPDGGYFEDVKFTYTDTGVDITATLTEDIGTDKVIFKYGKVESITFGDINSLYKYEVEMSVTGSIVGSTVSGSIDLDPDNLYAGFLTVVTDKDGEETIVGGSSTYIRFLAEAFDGDITPLALYGCAIATFYIMVVFFLIMIFSFIMRGRMEKTRERMEKEGRLYPQGYGKCEQCGAVVLPGEINCRKCGAYIDRPEEMKPNKKDFFECSDCGAEVPMDAKLCPKCGAEFDEEEFEVEHADGTTETTKESFICPECSAVVPGTATFCTKCGAKFNK